MAANRQTDRKTYTRHVRNAVMLVWGSLRLATNYYKIDHAVIQVSTKHWILVQILLTFPGAYSSVASDSVFFIFFLREQGSYNQTHNN